MIMFGSFLPSPWLVSTTKAYLGVGADIVMESLAQLCAYYSPHQHFFVTSVMLYGRTSAIKFKSMSYRPSLGITIVLATALAFSQTNEPSLGDVARDSKQAHPSKQSSKVITNNDLLAHTPAPAPGEPDRQLVVKSDNVKVFYRKMGDRAEIMIEVPEGVLPTLRVDVNQDGAIDQQDTYYGVRNSTIPCAGYLISERLSTRCGALASDADLKVTSGGDGTDFIWSIPVQELSKDKDSVNFVIAYYSAGRGTNYFPSVSFSDPIKIKF